MDAGAADAGGSADAGGAEDAEGGEAGAAGAGGSTDADADDAGVADAERGPDADHLDASAADADEPPPLPGLELCPSQVPLEPLNDGCTEPVCYATLRLDYLTLELLGWGSNGGPATPVETAGAREAASSVFDAHDEYLSSSVWMSGPDAGLYTAFAPPGDYGAFALVGEQSGVVVVAGGIVWQGMGDYWVPAEWNPAADIACGRQPVHPTDTYLDPASCDTWEETDHATASEALDVAVRTNLAAHVAAQGPFSAFVYLYTPALGVCIPWAAEYIVVLSQKRM